jgi:hypothetical protein
MSEWHLKRARSRLQHARKALGEIPLCADYLEVGIMNVLSTIDIMIAAIDIELGGITDVQAPPFAPD